MFISYIYSSNSTQTTILELNFSYSHSFFLSKKDNMLPSIYYYSTSSFSFPRRMLLHSSYVQHHQPPPQNEQTYDSPPLNHGSSFDSNVVMIFSVLLCLLIFSICVNCLIRCMLKCLTMITQERTLRNTNNNDKEVVTSGVDQRALKTFPVVRYSKDVEIQGLSSDCVICLSEFKAREKVRILPKCHHGFHVKCIDKWLSSQSSCPTCRQSMVDTCHKIIGCDDHHQPTSPSSSSSSSSSSLPSSSSSEMVVAISIVPLEREDVIRNQIGQ